MAIGTESTQSPLARLTREGIRYIGAGLVVFPLGLGVSMLAHEVFGWSEQVAGAIAIVVLLAVGFYLGRSYVFHSTRLIHHQLVRFLFTAATMRGAEYCMFLVFLMVADINYLVSLTAALAISSMLKFFLYRFLVF